MSLREVSGGKILWRKKPYPRLKRVLLAFGSIQTFSSGSFGGGMIKSDNVSCSSKGFGVVPWVLLERRSGKARVKGEGKEKR